MDNFGQMSRRSCAFPDTGFAFSDRRLVIGAQFAQHQQNGGLEVDLPHKKTGTCPVGTIPVYRLWNLRVDSNHCYTTSAEIKVQMLAAGYLDEGVVMCALQ